MNCHSAKLIWITPNAEDTIAYCARVSNPANQDNKATAPKLLSYCIKNKHWSVFEMASMCIEIKTTRAIAAQILRHRSFSFQEFSQRYAIPTELSLPELRSQDSKNRQNSIDDVDRLKQEELLQEIELNFSSTQELYDELIRQGIAKECARGILPLNTVTRLYMSGTIRSWLHYIDLRGDNGTQKEHQTIARAIGEILSTELPTVAHAMWS